MSTTFLYRKGGYFLCKKELFLYYCGHCKTAPALTAKGKQKYCHECGYKLDWKRKMKTVNHLPNRIGV